MSNLEKRIEKLNDAYLDITNALKVIKIYVKEGKDSDVYFWRIEKSLDALHKLILTDLKKEIVDEEFDKIVKKFKR